MSTSKRNAVTAPRTGEIKMNRTTASRPVILSTPRTIRTGMAKAAPHDCPDNEGQPDIAFKCARQ